VQETELSWQQSFGTTTSGTDSGFRREPFDHRESYEEEMGRGVFQRFLTTIVATIKCQELEVFGHLRAGSDEFFALYQFDYPWVPARKLTHHVSAKIDVDLIPLKDTFVCSAHFECGFAKGGCPVKWKQTWYLTPSGSAKLVERLDPDRSPTHVHLHGIDSSSSRKRKSIKAIEDELPCAKSRILIPIEPSVFHCGPTPIARLAIEISSSSMSELESGNKQACNASYNEHRGASSRAKHEMTPWITDDIRARSPMPSAIERVRLYKEFCIQRDKAKCADLDPDDREKLRKLDVWGQIQMIHEASAGILYLKMGRVHVKVAQNAAKKCKGLTWDASGGFVRHGVMFMPILLPGYGTSGQSRLAPRKAIGGWLVYERFDHKYGIDHTTLKVPKSLHCTTHIFG
jgi:hypothetical protein